MSEFLQQLFNFYIGGGWLWLALITLLLLIFMLIDNQRRQRQALAWILLMTVCLFVFAPSLFYSLSEGKVLTQSTREIFYAGLLGVMGAVAGVIGYVVSFRGGIKPPGNNRIYAHTNMIDAGPLLDEMPQDQDDGYAAGLTGNVYTPQVVGLPTVLPLTGLDIGMNPASPPQALFENPTLSMSPMATNKKELAPAWLQDQAGHQYPLFKGMTQIGREDDQDIRLMDLSVSRRHLLIHYEQYPRASAFILQAVGQAETSLNGFLVGKDRKQLYDGDRIRLGKIELTFFIQTRR
jgi:hypothetical protein